MKAITIESKEGATVTLLFHEEKMRDKMHRLFIDAIRSRNTEGSFEQSADKILKNPKDITLKEVLGFSYFKHMVVHDLDIPAPKTPIKHEKKQKQSRSKIS